MTQDEILQMAREAGLDPDLWNYTDAFERFAKLVAEHEREACAQLCEDLWEDDGTAWDCAVAIEKRGNQ